LFQEASAKITKGSTVLRSPISVFLPNFLPHLFVSPDFQDISTQIVNIENEFKARNVSSTAALIRRLQNKERELLQIVRHCAEFPSPNLLIF